MFKNKIELNDFLDYIYFKKGAGGKLVPRKPAGVVFAVFKVLTRGEKDKKDSSRIKKAKEYYKKSYTNDLNIGNNKIKIDNINNDTLKEKIDLVKKFIKAHNNVELKGGKSLSKRVSLGWLNVGEKEFKIHLKAYRDANPAHKNFLPGITIGDNEFSEKDKEKIARKVQKKKIQKIQKWGDQIAKANDKLKKAEEIKNLQSWSNQIVKAIESKTTEGLKELCIKVNNAYNEYCTENKSEDNELYTNTDYWNLGIAWVLSSIIRKCVELRSELTRENNQNLESDYKILLILNTYASDIIKHYSNENCYKRNKKILKIAENKNPNLQGITV